MKKIYSILALLLIFKAGAQSPDISAPDYVTIEKNITDKNSPYNYDKLFDRYTKADTTMTMEEKRHLYYGYSLTDNYAPFRRSDAEKELYQLLVKKDPDPADYQNVLDYTATILKNYPFSLRMKEYRIYCFKELGKIADAEKEMLQKDMIIDAILSSGDGTTKNTSIHIINPVNEYELIDLIGYEYAGNEQLIDNKYDFLAINENSYNMPGLFFDVSTCLNALEYTNAQQSVTMNARPAE